MKKIAFVSQSGMYDYERDVIAKHAPALAEALVVEATFPEKLFTTRIDHVDTVVYFDRSEPFFLSHVSLNTSMIMHAAELSKKGIHTILISRNADQKTMDNFYRVWWISHVSIYEAGQIEKAIYHFDTHEVQNEVGNRVGDRTFASINWAEFQKRFLEPQK